MKTMDRIRKEHMCLLLFSLLLLSIACSKEEVTPDPEPPTTGVEPPSGEELESINNYLATLSAFEQEPEAGTQEVGEPESPFRNPDEVREECVVQRYKTSPGFDELLSLDPTTDVIYPGAMLKGESISDGQYIGINGGRAPITLSVSLQNIDGTSSVDINDPKLSTIRDGIKSVLQQGVNGGTAAKLNFTIEEVYSEDHLTVALGANYRGLNKDVAASFNFSSSEFKYKYVIKYFQEYYTIDLDLPPNNNPGALFTEIPSLNSTSPVIVSSVKYGRMVLYTVESNASLTNVQSAFSASFNSSDANGNVDYQNIINSSKIEALVIGGSGKDAAQAVSGPAGVYEYITNGGNYSADSPAAPLAYTLRFIQRDFPVARVVLSSEYNIRTCYEAYQKFGIQIYGFNLVDNDGESGNMEVWGNMSATLYQNGQNKGRVSYTRTTNNIINVEEGTFWNIPSDDDTKEIELYKPDLENDYVILSAEFTEGDLWPDPDDYLGKVEEKILLKDLQMGKGAYIRVNLSEHPGTDMRTYFYAWRIY